MANLEGSLPAGADGRPGRCDKPPSLCLGVVPALLERLRGGPFAALSLANNHAFDFGAAAHEATAAALRALSVEPLDEAGGPGRVVVDGVEWALVAVNLVGRSPLAAQRALERARLQVGLGWARSPRVAVLPHWGREYDGRVWPQEEAAARLFRRWGATVIAGAHAHVSGEVRCVADAVVAFGLGNLLFDQADVQTRRGLALRCCPGAGGLSCRAALLGADEGSLTLRWWAEDGGALTAPRFGPPCTVTSDAPGFTDEERRAWQRHPGASRFVFVQPFRSLGPGTFFALHQSHSRFDGVRALRPYVFRVEGGRHRDLWSGTALARPFVVARLVGRGAGERLCVLHRGDSFLAPRPDTPMRRWQVYRWTGFGFRGVTEPEVLARCEDL